MSDYNLPRTTIEHNRRKYGVFSWQGQAPQYDQLGPKGEIVYRQFVEYGNVINTLLAYDPEYGYLSGILNHYPYEVVDTQHRGDQLKGDVLQTAGSVNIFAHPGVSNSRTLRDQLLAEAKRHWPNLKEPDDDPLWGKNTVEELKWAMNKQAFIDGNRRMFRLSDQNR